MKSMLIRAGRCLHENNHRKAPIPFDGLFRGTHSFVVQFFLSRGRAMDSPLGLIESQDFMERGVMVYDLVCVI
jgi:hypothetical protein